MASVKEFGVMVDRLFQLAKTAQDSRARRLAAGTLSDQQIVLARELSELLERNNEAEERADMKIAAIYNGAERDIYVFLFAVIAGIRGYDQLLDLFESTPVRQAGIAVRATASSGGAIDYGAGRGAAVGFARVT